MTVTEGTQGQPSRDEVENWQAGLEEIHALIAHRFRRSEVRQRSRRYLAGLLGRVDRKNGWQMAEQLGERGPQGVQRLLNAADWDTEAVRDDLRDYVVEQLGDDQGVLVVDETGFLKKGTKSVGVKRQYSGTAGRIENCQIGVFLAYASPKGKAFLDRELYLPEEWAGNQDRRKEAGVPAEVEFATKPKLARRMLERAFGAGVPASWVAADSVYGNDGSLRAWLESGGRAYVMEVSCAHSIWQDGESNRADEVIGAQLDEAWTTLSAGKGSQGPRLYDWTWVRLSYTGKPGTARWLLARRSLSDPTEIAYYRVFGPEEATLAALVKVAGSRWTIEEGFEQAKEVVGLDQYEVRKYNAWYRHITLSLLAHAYLEATRSRVNGEVDQEAAKGGTRQPS
jgi:SRSO17 transposase